MYLRPLFWLSGCWFICIFGSLSFQGFFFFFLRERGREGERERNISVWLPLTHPPTGNLAHNPGICPDWELNPVTLWLVAHTQSTELHQWGLKDLLYYKYLFQIFPYVEMGLKIWKVSHIWRKTKSVFFFLSSNMRIYTICSW